MTEPEQLPYHQQRLLRKLNLAAPLPTRKERKPLKRISKKKMAIDNAAKDAGTDGQMDRWFEERRKEMTGKCCLCGGKTEKHNDQTYRRSIHHLLDKRKKMFPSVKTHPSNFLEVCYYENSCHQNIHNGNITYELLKDSAEWTIIKEKLLLVLPMVAPEERKNKLYSKLNDLIYSKI